MTESEMKIENLLLEDLLDQCNLFSGKNMTRLFHAKNGITTEVVILQKEEFKGERTNKDMSVKISATIGAETHNVNLTEEQMIICMAYILKRKDANSNSNEIKVEKWEPIK